MHDYHEKKKQRSICKRFCFKIFSCSHFLVHKLTQPKTRSAQYSSTTKMQQLGHNHFLSKQVQAQFIRIATTDKKNTITTPHKSTPFTQSSDAVVIVSAVFDMSISLISLTTYAAATHSSNTVSLALFHPILE